MGLQPHLALQDRLQAKQLIVHLPALGHALPVVAGDALLRLLLAGHVVTEQWPGAGHQVAVLIAQPVGGEVARGRRAEHNSGLADHRDHGHGAGDQAPAQLGGDQPLEVSVQRPPVGFPLPCRQIRRVAQGELGEAALVGPLFEGGGDRAEQEHRAHPVAAHLTAGGSCEQRRSALAAGHPRKGEDRLHALLILPLVALRLVEHHRNRILTDRLA